MDKTVFNEEVWRNERGETYEEQEIRLDKEEAIVKRNAAIFSVFFILGFLIFTYFFISSIEEKSKLLKQKQSNTNSADTDNSEEKEEQD
ncbi:MAG: hypothetical protein LN588_04265 [Rickettsia endosymbiont of Bryobia graminum]|nr:hypothetical protein [Rickettsia endosymbiont of Bryobia graminum]